MLGVIRTREREIRARSCGRCHNVAADLLHSWTDQLHTFWILCRSSFRALVISRQHRRYLPKFALLAGLMILAPIPCICSPFPRPARRSRSCAA
jgi:hypothetical protein